MIGKNISYLSFFHGKNPMEVADEIGISQAQVSRLEKAALKLEEIYLKNV
jgi:RNA polymerase sporulation-specific sigma factor